MKYRQRLATEQRAKQLETQRLYRLAHADVLRARALAYYHKHRDAILAKKAAERLHERAGRPERVPHQRLQSYGPELVRVPVKGWGCA